MNVEVIRTKNSLAIRWANEGGDLWTVTKAFGLGTRTMHEAQIECSAEVWPIEEGQQAQALARDMDHVFTRPEDFDRVKRTDYPASGAPAWILPSANGGPIYIAVAMGEQSRT